jgi:hypothetical protein
VPTQTPEPASPERRSFIASPRHLSFPHQNQPGLGNVWGIPVRVTTSVLDRQTRRDWVIQLTIRAGRPDQHSCGLDFFGHRPAAGDDKHHLTVYILLRREAAVPSYPSP